MQKSKDDVTEGVGSLFWASAIVRAGVIFINRLLVLLRKLKRPNHSIHFSEEAKKDVLWWLRTLETFNGKSPIPPAVWTPLVFLHRCLFGWFWDGLGQSSHCRFVSS